MGIWCECHIGLFRKSKTKSRQSRVYHQFLGELHIIKAERFVYHHCESFLIHTYRCDEIQHGCAVLMIYTLKRDDIPLLSQWIKNRQVETCRFLVRVTGLEYHFLTFVIFVIVEKPHYYCIS